MLTNADGKPFDREAGMPVHPDNDWHTPAFLGKLWTVDEIHAALRNLGFVPLSYDSTHIAPCECEGKLPDCAICGGVGEAPVRLTRSKRWAKDGDESPGACCRVPDVGPVPPGIVANVVAAMAKA